MQHSSFYPLLTHSISDWAWGFHNPPKLTQSILYWFLFANYSVPEHWWLGQPKVMVRFFSSPMLLFTCNHLFQSLFHILTYFSSTPHIWKTYIHSLSLLISQNIDQNVTVKSQKQLSPPISLLVQLLSALCHRFPSFFSIRFPLSIFSVKCDHPWTTITEESSHNQ